MTRTRLKCCSLLVFCVLIVIFRLSLATNSSIGSIDELTSFPVARGTECVLPFFDSINSSNQTIVLQLCGECPICTNYGVPAGHIRISGDTNPIQSTTCSSFTLRQLRDGLVVFQHYYQAGLEMVVFNMTVIRYEQEQVISHDFIHFYAIPFTGNFTLLTEPQFLLREGEGILVDSEHLTFTTNFLSQNVDPSYRVLTYSQYGALQVLEGSEWISINQRLQKPRGTFTQSEINANKVGYNQTLLLNERNVTDKLKFQVYSSQLKGPNVTLTFHILSFNSPSIETQLVNINTNTTIVLTEGKETHINGQLFSLSLSPSSIRIDSSNFPLSYKQFDLIVTIIHVPQHGTLHIEGTPLTAGSVFNYKILLSSRVVYTHDGSDTITDKAVINISVRSVFSQALLTPNSLINNTVLHFIISPVNDNSPRLIQNRSISPLEGSYITLNSSFFDIIDSDRQEDFLIVVSNQTEGSGYFARQNLDIKLNRFYMSEVRAKKILYTFQHLRPNEVLDYYHNITISDGLHTIKERLHVSVVAMPISVSIRSNTSCLHTLDVLEQGSSLSLSKALFNIQIATMERLSEVIVNVITPPTLAVLMFDNVNVSSFSYPDFSDVLYNLTNHLTQETHDNFSLQFAIGHGMSNIIAIPLCITPLPYPELINLTSFSVPSKGGKVISSSILHTTQSGPHNPSSIVYTIVQKPRHGNVTNSTTTLEVSSFTQEDIDLKRIYYGYIREHEFSEYDDGFRFSIRNTHYILPGTYEMNIRIKHNVLNVTNKGIYVIEGGSHRIQKTEFSIEPLAGYTMYIYIQQFPNRGNLSLARPEPAPPVLHPPTFNLVDLDNGYLTYTHNGEEEPTDHFTFLIVAFNSNNDHHIFYGQFMIHVNMTNDKTPKAIYAQTTINIPEGGTKAITTDLINFGDEDYGFDAGNLKYTVTYFYGIRRDLCLRDHCFGVDDVMEWYQRDMSNGELYFKAVNNQLGSVAIVYEVSDGLNSIRHQVVTIMIVEIEAHRNSSEILVVNENSFAILRSNNIDYAAVDSSGMIVASEMIYTISVPPSSGSLHWINNSQEVITFTQSDINSGLVIYQQNGQNRLNDSFGFSLEIRSFTTSGNVTISINPVDDDLPSLNIDKVLFVVNGSVAHIDSSILSITDPDTLDPTRLIYFVKGSSAGKLKKRSLHGSVYYRTTSFTQYDINKELVYYKHDLLTSWSDYIYLNISDSTNMQDITYSLRVIVVSGFIVPAYTDAIRLREGANVTIHSSKLVIRHPYFSTIGSGRGRLARPLANGEVLLNGNLCDDNCVFGLDDIKRGRLMYVHDGSETTHDQLTIVITWGSFSTGQLTVPVIIEPVNDEPPRIINNTLLVIFASSNLTVTSQYLYATDIDTPPHLITYRFSITPSQKIEGSFVVNGSQSDQFTQADINNGLVVFVDRHKYDGFTPRLSFTVSDGVAVVPSNFYYRPEVVRLSILVHNSVTVSMNGSAVISNNILSASTNKDIDASSIQYKMDLRDMKYGHILVNQTEYNNSQLVVSQFDIDSGLVVYKHMTGEYWESLDKINVVVFHPLAFDEKTISLQVRIQLLETKGSQFAVKKVLSLYENGIICLNQTFLDARNIRYFTWRQLHRPTTIKLHDLSLVFQVTRAPSHGVLTQDMNETDTFTEEQLVAGRVCYANSGHEVDSDNFLLQVIVKTPNGTIVKTTLPESIPIIIELYNDEKPYLVPSLSLEKSFIRGFREFITPADISVTDDDNSPENIYFTVIQSPDTVGRLVFGDSDVPIDSFTQFHINNRQLVFVPNELGISSFVFYFSDGTFNSTQSYNFTVKVEELSLNVSHSDLKMVQFKSFATITTSELNSSTNGNSSDTYFTVITKPRHGQLLVSNKISNRFTQNDLENSLVQYQLIDHKHYRDVLSLNVSNFNVSIIVDLSIAVIINGRVNNNVVLRLDNPSPLPSNLLDLSSIRMPLALRINLTSPLKYGYLSFKYLELVTKPETSFRYSMLEEGKVYYTWSPNDSINMTTHGTCEYTNELKGAVNMMTHNTCTYTEELKGVVVLSNGMSPGEFHVNLTLEVPMIKPSPISNSTTIIISSTVQVSNEPTTGSNTDNNGLTASFFIPLVGLLIVVLLLLVVVISFCCYQSKVIQSKLSKGFVPPSSSLSQKLPSNLYYSPPPPPPLSGNGGPMHDDSDTESSISGADIMMVQNIPHQSHPMMTISASHTHIPYPQEQSYLHSPYPQEQSYHHSMSGISNDGPHSENVSYSHSPQLRHLQSPHSTNTYFPSHEFTRGINIRSTSPTRKPSPTRSRNVRPYASLTRVNVGRSSPVKSLRDYPITPVSHFPRPESSSSLGYDSSCLTEERQSRPSSVMTPIRTEGTISEQQNEVVYTTTSVRPALKTPQYWV